MLAAGQAQSLGMLSPSLVPRNPLAFRAKRLPFRRALNNASRSVVSESFQ